MVSEGKAAKLIVHTERNNRVFGMNPFTALLSAEAKIVVVVGGYP